MTPQPIFIRDNYIGSKKLLNKVAIITGGDSGIGRSVAIHFSREGANILIVYKNEDEDAYKTKKLVEAEGRKCLIVAKDIRREESTREVIEEAISAFGKINILVNNAAEQHPQEEIKKITAEQLNSTFQTNIFSFFYFTQAALPYLQEGNAIINTTSITAYRGSEHLLDYASTKGAIVAFTRSLSANLAQKKIRVNGVAPGPIWTPLIPSTFSAEEVKKFGKDVSMERPGQPYEVAPSFVFLASEDSSYMTGQVLHPNGGTVINS